VERKRSNVPIILSKSGIGALWTNSINGDRHCSNKMKSKFSWFCSILFLTSAYCLLWNNSCWYLLLLWSMIQNVGSAAWIIIDPIALIYLICFEESSQIIPDRWSVGMHQAWSIETNQIWSLMMDHDQLPINPAGHVYSIISNIVPNRFSKFDTYPERDCFPQ
jgi:hypothetical protein